MCQMKAVTQERFPRDDCLQTGPWVQPLYTVTDVRLEQHMFPKISNLLLEHKPTIHLEHRPIF